jgi:hypothetical protein
MARPKRFKEPSYENRTSGDKRSFTFTRLCGLGIDVRRPSVFDAFPVHHGIDDSPEQTNGMNFRGAAT